MKNKEREEKSPVGLNGKLTPGACKLWWHWIILSFPQTVKQSPEQTWLSSLSLCKERTFLMHKEAIHGRRGVAGSGLGLRQPFAMTQNSFRGQQDCLGISAADGMWREIFCVGTRSTQGNSWNGSTADALGLSLLLLLAGLHPVQQNQIPLWLTGRGVLAFQVQLSSTV